MAELNCQMHVKTATDYDDIYLTSKSQLVEYDNTISGLSATNVQDALGELENAVVNIEDELVNVNTELAQITNNVVTNYAKKDEVTNVMTPKGNIAYASLPTTGNTVGWYYYCSDGDGINGKGNYVWNGTSWYFGGTGDEGYSILKQAISSYEAEQKENFKIIKNYLDKSKAQKGYFYDVDGATFTKWDTGGVSDTHVFEKIKIEANKTYAYHALYAFCCMITDENDKFVSRLSTDITVTLNGTFTPTANGYIYITVVSTSALGYAYFMGNTTNSTLENVPYGVFSISSKPINKSVLTVKKDGSGNYTTLVNAINSITDASESNRYEVRIYTGIYDIISELGGDVFLASIVQISSQKQGLVLPDYVDLIGYGSVELRGLIADEKANTHCQKVSTVNCWQHNKLINLTITARNMRYAVHDETNNAYSYCERLVKDCKIVHYGNVAGVWDYPTAYGGGTGSGGKYEFENTVFNSVYRPFGMHNNSNQESNTVEMEGCHFYGGSFDYAIVFSYLLANTNRNKITIKDCIYDKPIVTYAEGGVQGNNVWDIYNFVEKTITIGA